MKRLKATVRNFYKRLSAAVIITKRISYKLIILFGLAVLSLFVEKITNGKGRFGSHFVVFNSFQEFLKHSLVYEGEDGLEIKSKKVIVTKYQPKERTY